MEIVRLPGEQTISRSKLAFELCAPAAFWLGGKTLSLIERWMRQRGLKLP